MIIRRASLAAALPVTTANDTRYFLNAVRCTPGVVEATNGHLAVRMTDRAPFADGDFPIVPGTESHAAPVLIPAEAVTSALKAMPKKSTLAILQTAFVGKAGEAVTLTTTDLQARQTITIDTADRTFPDFARVTPKMATDTTVDCLSVKLGVEVLETLLKALKASQTGQRQPTVTLTLTLPAAPKDEANHKRVTEDALIAEWRGEDIDGFAVMMPCRM